MPWPRRAVGCGGGQRDEKRFRDGGQIDNLKSGIKEVNDQVDNLDGTHDIFSADPPDRSTFIPTQGYGDPSLWNVVSNTEKPWPQPDTPAGQFAYLPAEEASNPVGAVTGAVSDAFSFYDLYDFIKNVTNFTCGKTTVTP